MDYEVIGAKQLAVLQIIHQQHGSAYGLSIEKSLRESKVPTSLPQIYSILEKLSEKRLVIRSWGDAIPERGGRPKREYQITPDGIRALSVAAQSFSGGSIGKWLPIGAPSG